MFHHSHSIVLSDRNALNSKRKSFRRTVKHRLLDPSENQVLDFKHEFRRSAIGSISATIDSNRSIFSNSSSRQGTTRHRKDTVSFGTNLRPNAAPGFMRTVPPPRPGAARADSSDTLDGSDMRDPVHRQLAHPWSAYLEHNAQKMLWRDVSDMAAARRGRTKMGDSGTAKLELHPGFRAHRRCVA